MTKEQAEKAGKLLGLPPDAVLLQQVPYKGSLPTAVPTDPLIYRWYEIVNVYGTTIKELIHEEFGDGIMSAIDFKMDIAREPDPKGDRVNVVLSASSCRTRPIELERDCVLFSMMPRSARCERSASCRRLFGRYCTAWSAGVALITPQWRISGENHVQRSACFCFCGRCLISRGRTGAIGRTARQENSGQGASAAGHAGNDAMGLVQQCPATGAEGRFRRHASCSRR